MLVAAELPIPVIEGALAAVMSFTLVGPLGIPWWMPLVCFALAAALISGLTRLVRDRLEGIGVDVSLFDAVALLIGAAVGTNGVAVVAAAGALLTATAAAGALCFACWALLDRLRSGAPAVSPATP